MTRISMVVASLLGLSLTSGILVGMSLPTKPPTKEQQVDSSLTVDQNLGPVQEITCEGVNFTVCEIRAQDLCGEGKWAPVAYPGDQFAMGHWIHDGGCYTGQSMLIRCKR